MDYIMINKAIEEYNTKSTKEIRKELQAITKTYKYSSVTEFCKKANITRPTYYKLNRNRRARPNFETYVKIKMIGPNPISKEKEEKIKRERKIKTIEATKEYQHKYYLRVTKVKRAEKRKEKEVCK